jgi:hypothetical protein
MSAVESTSVIDTSRRLRINHETWPVLRITTYYEQPSSDEHQTSKGRLYLPLYQRFWSWNGKSGLKNMRNFIDSILHNYPIPTIILNAIDDGVRERWEVYDGRHRVETLWRFVNNKFSILIKDTGRQIYYRDLCDADRSLFNERLIPVCIATNASEEQLSEVFMRLNSGKPLTNVDYCWSSKHRPLIRSTMEILEANKERFRELFGGADITHRSKLPGWVGLFAGITTGSSGNMTTSFERLSSSLNRTVPADVAGAAMDALFVLYSTANAVSHVHSKELKKYQTLGFINAFFIDAWLEAEDSSVVISNWVRIISHIRSTSNKSLVYVEGAQNLTIDKITKVRNKVNDWLNTGDICSESVEFTDDSDED